MKHKLPKNVSERYFAEIYRLEDGTFKVGWAQRRTNINQFITRWKNVNARNLAREMSKSSLVTR
jgi:hypothetical protein